MLVVEGAFPNLMAVSSLPVALEQFGLHAFPDADRLAANLILYMLSHPD